jgi:hypothetical protein
VHEQEHLPLDHVFDTTIIPALEQFTKGFPLWNGQLDSSCTAAYPKQVRATPDRHAHRTPRGTRLF